MPYRLAGSPFRKAITTVCKYVMLVQADEKPF